MKIISSFKDYYDCIQYYGQDDDLQYIRETKRIDLENHHIPWKVEYIGFCNKVYPLIRLGSSLSKDEDFCFSIEDLDKAYKRRFSDREKKVYEGHGGKHNYYWSRNIYIKFFKFEEVSHWSHTKKNKNVSKLFEEHNAPIWLIQPDTHLDSLLFLNPRLNQFGFQRIMPPYQAFQELQMWFSNQAKPFKPIPSISDKDMVTAKGFDKFSFRKAKSK